jgi:hypothetical protein
VPLSKMTLSRALRSSLRFVVPFTLTKEASEATLWPTCRQGEGGRRAVLASRISSRGCARFSAPDDRALSSGFGPWFKLSSRARPFFGRRGTCFSLLFLTQTGGSGGLRSFWITYRAICKTQTRGQKKRGAWQTHTRLLTNTSIFRVPQGSPPYRHKMSIPHYKSSSADFVKGA